MFLAYGEQLSPLGIVKTLNDIGGRNGVGRIDMVENRFVGMKSRGVYESPGMTVLYDALLVLEQLTMDRDLCHLRDRLKAEVAEMVYYGHWYCARMDALLAFNDSAMQHVTGEVTLGLYKGNIIIVSRITKSKAYSMKNVSFEENKNFNKSNVERFINFHKKRLK